jgi:hypothetical protein
MSIRLDAAVKDTDELKILGPDVSDGADDEIAITVLEVGNSGNALVLELLLDPEQVPEDGWHPVPLSAY